MTDNADTRRPEGWKNFYRFARRNKVRPWRNGRVPLLCLKDCWEAIRSAMHLEDLNRMMCYDEDDYRRRVGCEHKNFKWNFKGLNYKTIEFRQSTYNK